MSTSTNTTSHIRKWAVLSVTIAVVVLGYRWWVSDDGDERTGESYLHADEESRRMVFKDGRWVRVDPSKLNALLEDLASRTPGLVRISGTIRDSESGDAIGGAEVVFANELGESGAVADGDGNYRIEVKPGFYRAFARADDYVAVGATPFERLPQNQPDMTQVGVPRGELAPLMGAFRDQAGVDMHLRTGARIEGTVFDTSGRPISGVVVTGRLAGYQGMRTRLILGTDMDESDLDGSFALDVPAGPIELLAAHSDFAGVDQRNSIQYLEPGEQKRVDLTLQAGCILEGTVVDGRGERVTDGSLELHNGQPAPNDYYPVGQIDNGTFRLARTQLGDVRLRAWPWKSPPTTSQTFHCQNGTRYTDITFVVPASDPVLEGKILSHKGRPLNEAFIDIFPLDPSGMAQQERADIYGEWAFYSLPPGRYQVLAHVPNQGVAARTVTVPSHNVRLQLSGTGSIHGSTRGMQDGAFTMVIKRCMARTMDGDGMATFDEVTMPQASRIIPVENGSFYIEDLPACSLIASAKTSTRTEYMRVDIRSGAESRVSLDLRAPQLMRIYGVVTDPTGAPAEGVVVSRMQGTGAPTDHYARTVTDQEGRYEIELYTGDHMFLNGSSGWGEASINWSSNASERIDITLRE